MTLTLRAFSTSSFICKTAIQMLLAVSQSPTFIPWRVLLSLLASALHHPTPHYYVVLYADHFEWKKKSAFSTFLLTAHCCLNKISSLQCIGKKNQEKCHLLGFLKEVAINKVTSSLPQLFYLSSWYLFCFSDCSTSAHFHFMFDGFTCEISSAHPYSHAYFRKHVS